MQVDVICCQRVTLNQAQVTFGTNRATRPLISTLILFSEGAFKVTIAATKLNISGEGVGGPYL